MKLIDSIFSNKKNYQNATDKDKIDSFYMINKKLYFGKPQISTFFNDRNIDKASAIDLWNLYFRNTKGTPSFYWSKNPFKNEKSKVKKIPAADKEMLMIYEELSEKEYDFLLAHYRDDVEYKIKLLKRG